MSRGCANQSAQTALVRFRMSVSRINGYRFSFSVADNQRFCPFCVDLAEDESHVLFVGPVYSRLRENILLVCVQRRGYERTLPQIMR